MERELLDERDAERAADKDQSEQQREREAKEEEEREERESALAAAVHFERVAEAVIAICENDSGYMPDLDMEQFSDIEQQALHKLYEAKAAPDTKAIQLSASVRMKMFNQALAALYPTLSLAKLPKLNFEVEEYEAVAERVSEVREEIKSDAAVEAIFFKVKGAEKKKDDEDEDDEGDEDDEDDENKDDSDAEQAADDKQAKKKGSRIGRLFRRKPKAKPADEE